MATASLPSSAQLRGASQPELFGSEVPRVYTPPLRELNEGTTLGFAAIEFVECTLCMPLFPWQRWLLIHMLETLPDGTLRFRNVLVLVARQNGKSTLSIALTLFFMYVLGKPMVIGTAQDLDVAEEIWEGAVSIIKEIPELSAELEHVSRVNGQKAIRLTTGERYKVKAANRRAGRGLSGDLILLDELREHQDWGAWGAITKTAMARASALVLALSNAGDVKSVVLRHLRKMAHLTLGDPDGLSMADDTTGELAEAPDDAIEAEDDESLGIFEWSAPPGCDVWDRQGWAMANPSLGYSISARTLASAARTDPEWVFRTECLCQWSDGTLKGPFPMGSWDAGIDEDSGIAEGAPIWAWVDMSWNRSMTYIAFVGEGYDDRLHGEVVAARAGSDWAPAWLKERIARLNIQRIGIQARGAPISSALEDFRLAELPLYEATGADMATSTGTCHDMVRDKLVTHRKQPALDMAAATAQMRQLSDGAWVYDRKKSVTDIAPLVAWAGALWLSQPKVTESEKIPMIHVWADEDE